MSLLTDVGIADLILDTAGSLDLFGEPVTIKTRSTTLDSDGVPVATYVDSAAIGTGTDISAFRRTTAAIPATDIEVIVYQRSTTASLKAGDAISFRSANYDVISVRPDPAGATWTAQCRPQS